MQKTQTAAVADRFQRTPCHWSARKRSSVRCTYTLVKAGIGPVRNRDRDRDHAP